MWKTYRFLYEWYYLTGSNVAVFLPNVKLLPFGK